MIQKSSEATIYADCFTVSYTSSLFKEELRLCCCHYSYIDKIALNQFMQ